MIYLYIKTHNITNLKYLGKTEKDPFSYKGSGKYWLRHIKKHGNNVSTEILYQTEDLQDFRRVSLEYSKKYNIVKSKEWANLIEESGAGGDTSSTKSFINSMLKYHKSKPKKEYATRGMLGKKQSIKNLKAIKKANCCPVICKGKRFDSVGEAEKQYPNVRNWLDNDNYPDSYRLRPKTLRI